MEGYKNIKSLGVGIIAFDATEHLYNIISEFRSLVDYVVVAVQKVSYHGRPMDPTDLYEIKRLKEEGLIDKILYCKLDTTKFPRVQETIKRNLLLRDMTNYGCTHALVMDSDEFYTHDGFESALRKIDENDYEMTYCRYVNYYHDYGHYLLYPFKEGNYVPFVAKVKYHFGWKCGDFPKPSDPTRRFIRPKIMRKNLLTGEEYPEYQADYYEFGWDELRMHHLSWLRADIRKKMNDWSSATYFGDRLAIIDKAVERFSHFDDGNMQEQATILFNTPGNKVSIGKFEKQYIFPKVDYHDRVTPQPRRKTLLVLVHLTEEQVPLRECILDTWASELPEGTEVIFYSVSDFGKDAKQQFKFDYDVRHLRLSKEYVKDGFELTDAVFRIIHESMEKATKLTFKPEYILKAEVSQYVWVDKVHELLDVVSDDSTIFVGGLKMSERTDMSLAPFDGWCLMSWNSMEKMLSVVSKSVAGTPRKDDLSELFKLLDVHYFDANGLTMFNYLSIVPTDNDDLLDGDDIRKPSLHGIVKNCTVTDTLGRPVNDVNLLTTYKMRNVHELAKKGTYGDGYEYHPSPAKVSDGTSVYVLDGPEGRNAEDRLYMLVNEIPSHQLYSMKDRMFRMKYCGGRKKG